MRIILASQSIARRKLLEQIGVSVEVIPSNISELPHTGSAIRKLVLTNALRKAENISGRFQEGLIIGADTAVYADKRIIGKPRSKKEALETLLFLTSRPHWVYTAVAVIDSATGKEVTAVEKTKVFMHPLEKKDIADYFKKVSPLDKAGGFDIQGRGALFIRRVEGCFYTVVGLPLFRLGQLLKEFGVRII